MQSVSRPKEILDVLSRHRCEFIVIGGVCGVLHGAPISTFDLDLVHERSEGNIARLLGALDELEAYYREKPNHRIAPTAKGLQSAGHHLLNTQYGPLDLLGTVTGGEDYHELLPQTVPVQLGEAAEVRILALRMLIELKERMGGEKDRYALAMLKQLLKEKG